MATLEQVKARTARRKAAGIAIGMPNADRPFGGRGPAAKPAGDCPHLGGPTGNAVPCASCGGKRVELKLFACDVHGECLPRTRRSKLPAGVAGCDGCPERPR